MVLFNEQHNHDRLFFAHKYIVVFIIFYLNHGIAKHNPTDLYINETECCSGYQKIISTKREVEYNFYLFI